MSYPQTYVDHRNPDHHESIHPTRNIANAHVVAGEFLTSRYHDALQTVLHPLGESLDTKDQHALNDLGIVHANGSLNELSLSFAHTSNSMSIGHAPIVLRSTNYSLIDVLTS